MFYKICCLRPFMVGFKSLSAYCQQHGKKATIFCAKRNTLHANTRKCLDYGAHVIQVPYGYLTVVEKHARTYCEGNPDTQKITFGAGTAEYMKEYDQRGTSCPTEFIAFLGSGGGGT